MAQNKRQQPGSINYDGGSIKSMEFSQASGAKKVSEVGRSLLPLGDGAGGFTTNAAILRILPAPGRNLAIYNNSSTVGSVVVSSSPSQASLAAGACDAAGNVGIPCIPNGWTYVACFMRNYVIASNSSLMVFLIDDDTYVRPEYNILPGN